MLSAFVLATIATAYAQRAGQRDPVLSFDDLTHAANTFSPAEGSNNQNGNFKQNARLGLFVSEDGDNKAVSFQNAGIEIQNGDGEFINRNFLGAFVASQSCNEVKQNNNGRGVRFQFSGRNAAGNRLTNQFLQLFNQRSVDNSQVDEDPLVAADFRFVQIRGLQDANVQELAGSARSAIIFDRNNVNNQLFCLDLVERADAENDDDLADFLELLAFQEGSFEGFRVEDIVLTCDDKGKLEELERGFGGVVGFGAFERDVPNPVNANQLVTGSTLLIDGIQVTEWGKRHYANFEAVVSEDLCNSKADQNPSVLELDSKELRIENINLNADNWRQGSAINHDDGEAEGRIEQGSLREALVGSIKDDVDANSMFLLLNDKAVACCDLKDAADAIDDGDINIDFLNDVEEADTTEDNGHHNPHNPHNGGYNGGEEEEDENDDIVDSASSIVFSVGAVMLAVATLF